MNGYERFCYGLAGPLAERRAPKYPDLQGRLFRAHRTARAAAYLATLYVSATIAAAVVLVLAATVMLAARAPLLAALLLAPFASAWAAVSVFVLAPLLLNNEARERAKDVDEALPAGLNYMLALANAGVPPVGIWGSLAKQDVFGALAFEAERIHRDLALFSTDILHALRLAQERTPSAAFHEFLQGAISSFQSGVELESYIKVKGAQYQHESLEAQKRTLDTMGVLAETFLVMVVAAPLFLIILLTVMAINQGGKILFYGYMLTFVFIPLAQITMGALIRSTSPGSAS